MVTSLLRLALISRATDLRCSHAAEAATAPKAHSRMKLMLVIEARSENTILLIEARTAEKLLVVDAY